MMTSPYRQLPKPEQTQPIKIPETTLSDDSRSILMGIGFVIIGILAVIIAAFQTAP